tara:strand:- start:549 stop:797 length:249 start_codon:yes stop_codon:yes gene_type:complete
MNIYTVEFTCKCPSDNEVISYMAKIYSDNFILAEDLNSYVMSLKDRKIYQEKITVILKEKYNAKKVITYGEHQNVDIECIEE